MKKLQVALIQSHIIWENPVANRALFEEKINELPENIDVIVLPEMFTSGFTMNPQNVPIEEGEKTLEWMVALALEKDAAITGSLASKEQGNYFNRLFFVEPNGKYSVYDKRHTFTLAGENEVYEAGNEKILIDFGGFKICPMICYDLRFPVWSRNTENYDVLLYVANWPKPRIAAWDALLRARAIENMAYCIGVNRIGLDGLGYEYPGHTAVYDVLGNQVAFSDKEETMVVELIKEHISSNREKLRFLEDRDEFTLL